MHDLRAARFIRGAQRRLVVDLRDADPAAAVVGLHEERIADPAADLAEVEELCIAGERRLQVRSLLVRLRRQHPRVGNRETEAHHRAIRGVLLVRLERPGIVEDVGIVEDDRLLYPLAAGVSTSGSAGRQPGRSAPAGVDRTARSSRADLEAERVAAPVDREIEPLQDFFETDRPADVRTQRQTDPLRHVATDYPRFAPPVSQLAAVRASLLIDHPRRPRKEPGQLPWSRSRQFSQLCPSRTSS